MFCVYSPGIPGLRAIRWRPSGCRGGATGTPWGRRPPTPRIVIEIAIPRVFVRRRDCLPWRGATAAPGMLHAPEGGTLTSDGQLTGSRARCRIARPAGRPGGRRRAGQLGGRRPGPSGHGRYGRRRGPAPRLPGWGCHRVRRRPVDQRRPDRPAQLGDGGHGRRPGRHRTDQGYWLASADGGVYAEGSAGFYGSLGSLQPPGPRSSAWRPPPTARGTGSVAMDGGVFSFGDAAFYGSMGGAHARTSRSSGWRPRPDGKGYWLVAADGGVFSFGDAHFFGSEGGTPLNAPVTGMAATPDGNGYWLVAADGGIFTFGDAPFFGSTGRDRSSTTRWSGWWRSRPAPATCWWPPTAASSGSGTLPTTDPWAPATAATRPTSRPWPPSPSPRRPRATGCSNPTAGRTTSPTRPVRPRRPPPRPSSPSPTARSNSDPDRGRLLQSLRAL